MDERNQEDLAPASAAAEEGNGPGRTGLVLVDVGRECEGPAPGAGFWAGLGLLQYPAPLHPENTAPLFVSVKNV